MSIDNLIIDMFMYPRPWILSGAGISTDSGIPDFRSPGGIWERVDPIENFSAWALQNNPQGFFYYGIPMFKQVIEAKPNLAHLIVGELQTKRFIGPIITQNIDNLHQKGGANWVYEVHGHIRTATCMKCRKKVVSMEKVLDMIEKRTIPRCSCGGILKPDVVLFGDAMSRDFQDALNLIRAYQTMDNMIIVIGSSLTVAPVNSFPYEFEKLVIINNSTTALDRNAELILPGSASDILQMLRSRLIELNNGQELKTLPAGYIVGRLVSSLINSWNNIKNKTNIVNNEKDKLNKIMADVILMQSLCEEYPNYSNRQALEQYFIDYSLYSINRIKDEITATGVYINLTKEGYIPKIFEAIMESYYQAILIYCKNPNNNKEIVKELILQLLGVIGLYKYMSLFKIQEFNNSLADKLTKDVSGFGERYGLKFELEKALGDY